MKVVFVSRSTRSALEKTRGILDAYAVRIGDDTWVTNITQEGLETVRSELARSASRATAVSCHIVRKGDFQFLWKIGKKRAFAPDGTCAVKTSSTGHFSLTPRRPFHYSPLLAELVTACGYGHDLGKATVPIQEKLVQNMVKADEVHHSIYSLLIMESLTGNKPSLYQDREPYGKGFMVMERPQTVAALASYLIGSHHHLMANSRYHGSYKHITVDNEDKGKRLLADMSALTYATPLIQSAQLDNTEQLSPELRDALFLYSRLALQVGDHYASCRGDKKPKADKDGQLIAKSLVAGQQIREGLISHTERVATAAKRVATILPNLARSLPGLDDVERGQFMKPAEKLSIFEWQNKAVACAQEHAAESNAYQHGCFIILCADTGTGKTIGAVKILNALAGENPLRISTMFDLRSLTLQTGAAYREQLQISPVNLAVLIGSREVKDLSNPKNREVEDYEVEVAGGDHLLPRILSAETTTANKKNLVAAPMLVGTIDYLMTGADWRWGAHTLAQLRIATSDLILDEIDGYDLAHDLPAVSRLCYLCGLFGRRLLLSSATLLPEIAGPLYAAYAAGWRSYAAISGCEDKVWSMFASSSIGSSGFYFNNHKDLVDNYQRFAAVAASKALKNIYRRGVIRDITSVPDILSAIRELHADNHVQYQDLSVSIGLVRFARTRDVVWSAIGMAQLLEEAPQQDMEIGVLVYHSNMPLGIRMWLERQMDQALRRDGKEDAMPSSRLLAPLIARARKNGKKHVCLAVFVSPVEEIGRNHDTDWIIAEPSSLRSLCQLAGRANRHRCLTVTKPNIIIMRHNLRHQENPTSPCFCKPGFETSVSVFASHDMEEIAPGTSAVPMSAMCLHGDNDDLLLQWEKKRIHDHLDNEVLLGFLGKSEARLVGEHMEKHVFRASPEDLEIFYEVPTGEWKLSPKVNDNPFRPGLIMGELPPLSQKAWLLNDDDLDTILAEIEEWVGVGRFEGEFSSRYMTCKIREGVDTNRDCAHPLLGVFPAKKSILLR